MRILSSSSFRRLHRDFDREKPSPRPTNPIFMSQRGGESAASAPWPRSCHDKLRVTGPLKASSDRSKTTSSVQTKVPACRLPAGNRRGWRTQSPSEPSDLIGSCHSMCMTEAVCKGLDDRKYTKIFLAQVLSMMIGNKRTTLGIQIVFAP